MKTFDKFIKVINESDYILSEAQRYLEILLEKDSEALKQYKKGEKSFQKGFGKNIKPTVVQPGLDLYKAGGPYVPDKTTFKDTGKKVPKMEPKPQFGTPKTPTKSGAPDRTLVKKAIKDVKDSEKRLFQKGLGKGTAGVKGVEGKSGISLPRQRKYTKDIIRDLSAKTTQSDARMRGSSTEGTAGASGSSKTTKPKLTPTKGVKQSEVSKKAQEFTKKTNQARVEKISKPKVTTSKVPAPNNLFNRVKPKGDGKVKNSKGIGNKYRGNSPEAKALRRQAIDARSGKPQSPPSSNIVKNTPVTSSDRPNKGYGDRIKTKGSDRVTKNYTRGKKPYVTKTTVTGDILRGRPKNYAKSKGSSIPNRKEPQLPDFITNKNKNSTKNTLAQQKPSKVTGTGEPQLPKFTKTKNPSYAISKNTAGFDSFYSDKAYKAARKLPKPVQKIGKSKAVQKVLKTAIKNPYVAAGAAIVGTAAAGYGAYKAYKALKKDKTKLKYKDFKSLSTPSDPDKGKVIDRETGKPARFSSTRKIPKSSSAEFKSKYYYK